ncbi:MAG TPA: hypothetical protein VJ801_14450 [Polyangia bacterium]|jgi:hypothetical protein|nr:hypothetical protein [Polyangia bacterium]
MPLQYVACGRSRHPSVLRFGTGAAFADPYREPEWLCPVCLKKLQWNVGLDVRAHYQQQRALFERAGFKESVVWADRQLAQLGAR